MFEAGAHNRLRVGDIACIGTAEGQLHLAAVVDSWRWEVVSRSVPERITVKRTADAAEQAVDRKDPC